MKVAVVGATGLVGANMIKVLEERNFPITELIPVASGKSAGKKILFKGKEWSVVTLEQGIAAKPAVALFSAGSDVSKEWAPKFASAGAYVVDNSACWRMDPGKQLVVPEINADVLVKKDAPTEDDRIIANPNCSTIQMLVAIHELHKAFKIKRIVVSTYQCITGTGSIAVEQMDAERAEQSASGKSCYEAHEIANKSGIDAYPYRIDLNILPHIDKFLPDGYTKEEMKMVNETHKIMRDDSIRVSPTAVRVPVTGGHGESVNLEFEKAVTLEDVYEVFRKTKGVTIQENLNNIGDTENLSYPMPLYARGKDDVFVGRVRLDPSVNSGINFWCVADNLRKGAATNAVQIAEELYHRGIIG